MRDDVMMKLGAREYPLRPAFEVMESFEGRYGGLLDFANRIIDGSASLERRAWLVLKAMQAADPEVDASHEGVMRRMWERGHWHRELVAEEVELIERLIYTPEQYRAKKEREKAEEEAMRAAFSETLSPSPL